MKSFLQNLLNINSSYYEVFGFWGTFSRRVLPFRFRQWWAYNVRPIYAPQHSNLRAAIPKTWSDIDDCIESFLFACVVDFVEKEDGLKDWEHPDQEGVRKEQAGMLREVYEWAKAEQHDARKVMCSFERNEKTSQYLLWIVTWRGYFWT